MSPACDADFSVSFLTIIERKNQITIEVVTNNILTLKSIYSLYNLVIKVWSGREAKGQNMAHNQYLCHNSRKCSH